MIYLKELSKNYFLVKEYFILKIYLKNIFKRIFLKEYFIYI